MGEKLKRACMVFFVYFICLIVVVCFTSETVINCAVYTDTISLGPVDEGYSGGLRTPPKMCRTCRLLVSETCLRSSRDAPGDVELVTGISAGLSVKLVPYIFPDHVQFLELVFTPGNTTATVRTREALDADVLASVSSNYQ